MTRVADPVPPAGGPLHRFATLKGVRLHYVEAGRGPLVVLLHGFPEFWYSWRHQIPVLAAAGYRVVAPDLRGYNTSSKPKGVGSYRIQLLVHDIIELIRAVGANRASVVGHDWGGLIAWQLAMLRPELVERLVVLNAPHPAAYRRELLRSTQLLRSAYAGFFQLHWLPERLIRARDFAVVERVFRREPVRPEAFTDEDIRRYKDALAQHGALPAMVNYYRAAARYGLFRRREDPSKVQVPTLVIWGERDPYLVGSLTKWLEKWVPGVRVERLPVSHWVPVDAPEEVNRLLLDFLPEGSGT